ncbi:ABC transporter permease [Glaciecola sp. XM2]|jgi:putative ABC transport system permease protein|uniref:ABC transporter permease n=1 Tax=Glaciecola sp. XM2 TaxID=1914931 RepID=UPI001BDF4BEA|nr:ABC transporter permease [Glaciecola sp. XM2]MBT1449329.1 ABC transporter permease [Glaciecola sp. XM2]
MFVHYLDLAWRSFKRTPLVSVLMVIAIAIGIGITMTSLSVYHMMAMDPIPHKSDKLHAVQLKAMDDGEEWWTEDNIPTQITYKDAMFLNDVDLPFRKTASTRTGFTVHMNSSDVKPFLESARVTSSEFFPMFDLPFLYGGAWTEQQYQSASPVVVISQSINEKLFGGENSVGKQVYLDDQVFQIVGVIKEWDIHTKYYDLNNGAFNSTENLFIPLSLIEANELATWGNTNGWKFEEINTFQERLNSELLWMQFWVELNNAQDKQAFGDYLNNYLSEQATLGRFERESPKFALRDVNEWMAYNNVVSEDNRLLVGLSFLFLTVCLVNILALLLAKFLRRAPEIGVRRALGASKSQVFAQHLVEVSMLGFFGGIVGIGIAQLGLWGVRSTYSYFSALATMDISMLLAAPSIAIVSCLIAGAIPAWLVCKTQPAIYLKTQ